LGKLLGKYILRYVRDNVDPSGTRPVSRRREETRTDLGLLLLALVWGVNFPLLKAILTELGPLALNALRFPLAAFVLAAALRSRRRRPALERRDVPRILALAAVGHVAYQLAFIHGIDGTRAGNASLILATTPVWALVLSVARGHEEVGLLLRVGVGATVVGMVLVVLGRGEVVGVGADTLRGDLLMVAAALLWAVYTVGGRRPVGRYGSLRVTAWTLWAGTPGIVVAGIPQLRATDWGTVPAWVWAGTAFSGVFAVALAYLIWYRSVRTIGTARTAVASNGVPVVALVTAWVWLGETPTALQVAGAVVILAGLAATRRGRRGQDPGSSSLRWRTSGNS
jgi:drug/metabolite transporter (DMT)-like permease